MPYVLSLAKGLSLTLQEALEEEEELEEGEGSLLDYTEDLTQGKQEEEEAGKASESAVQESQAKLNPTKNSTKVCPSNR